MPGVATLPFAAASDANVRRFHVPSDPSIGRQITTSGEIVITGQLSRSQLHPLSGWAWRRESSWFWRLATDINWYARFCSRSSTDPLTCIPKSHKSVPRLCKPRVQEHVRLVAHSIAKYPQTRYSFSCGLSGRKVQASPRRRTDHLGSREWRTLIMHHAIDQVPDTLISDSQHRCLLPVYLVCYLLSWGLSA
jgi:hypothetical protein